MRTLSFRMISALLLIANLVATPCSLEAQQSSTDVPSVTLRSSTRLVIVDVVVTDKKGQPVTGLKADDLTVEENGKKQKIGVFVSRVPANRMDPASAPPGIISNHPENVGPAGVPIVLVLDATNSPFKEQAYGRSQMLQYVAEQGQSGHPMSVLALTDRLHVLQQFTSDPQVLMTAIKNFKPQEQILQAAPGPAPTSVPADMSGPGAASAAMVLAAQSDVADFANAQVAYNLERRTLITIEAMRSLSRMLGGLQGRKNVVWLTAELPFDLIPEDRNISDAEYLANLPSRSMNKTVQLRAAGAMAEEQRSLYGTEIRVAESQLASANIAIYSVDLRGLVSGLQITYSGAHDNDIHGAGLANKTLAETSSVRTSQGTMEEVAAETGGKPYINENEIKEGIALAAADDKGSNEIAYYPENKKWDGKYRSIKGKIAQDDTRIRYPKGYFAVDTTQIKNPNYEQDVASALQVNAPFTQIYFMAQAKPTDPGKVRVVFLVDAHTVSAAESGGSNKMNFSIYACIFGPNGKYLASHSIKVDRAFDSTTYQQILDKGMM